MGIHLGVGKREVARFEATEEYIRISQNMFAHFIATQSILDLCEETERTPGRGWRCSGGRNQVYT